jgi:hypothetical protein
MGIERDLVELLHDHDCVIVPHWGGFLTHYRPARLDEARHLIHPPAKELGFNRHLVRNDGLLADHLAKRDRMDFGQATELIEHEVGHWNGLLARDGRLELPHMGIFFRDAEGNLQFDPDKRSNFLRDAFGLRPIKALPVKEEMKMSPAPVIQMPLPVIEEGSVSRRYVVRWAAAAVVLILSGAAIQWAIQEGDRGSVRWSDLSPFGTTNPARYDLPPEALPEPVFSASVFTLPVSEVVTTMPISPGDSLTVTIDMRPAVPDAPAPVDSTAVAMPSVDRAVRLRFHVIGGCFAQPENADKCLAELQQAGYPAIRLTQRGELFPVAFGSYGSRQEALDALTAIRERGHGSAWLLVR